jgi:hypothetical protein
VFLMVEDVMAQKIPFLDLIVLLFLCFMRCHLACFVKQKLYFIKNLFIYFAHIVYKYLPLFLF